MAQGLGPSDSIQPSGAARLPFANHAVQQTFHVAWRRGPGGLRSLPIGGIAAVDGGLQGIRGILDDGNRGKNYWIFGLLVLSSVALANPFSIKRACWTPRAQERTRVMSRQARVARVLCDLARSAAVISAGSPRRPSSSGIADEGEGRERGRRIATHWNKSVSENYGREAGPAPGYDVLGYSPVRLRVLDVAPWWQSSYARWVAGGALTDDLPHKLPGGSLASRTVVIKSRSTRRGDTSILIVPSITFAPPSCLLLLRSHGVSHNRNPNAPSRPPTHIIIPSWESFSADGARILDPANARTCQMPINPQP
ncbi:hypothetical protein BKA56DRAFT_683627 [Ilyonectria sp. MPI-CAGE-AT-0026]|nr:hypothetical protein BKA56DRAFT_683627 [Ilyonectria sp. MPI-CAGE-AT-0026]